MSELNEKWNNRVRKKQPLPPVQANVAQVNLNAGKHTRMDQWIMEVALSQPDAIALIHGHQRLSYAQLAGQARNIGKAINRILPNNGNVPVALCLPSGIDAIVAMLGVLLSGRCYMPLDPEQPQVRQKKLIDDAHCALIISVTDSNSLDEVVATAAFDKKESPISVTVRSLVSFGETAPVNTSANVQGGPAYLIYTSGSF